MEACDEDEDVVLKGSALYQHLVSSGYESELEIFHQNENIESDQDQQRDTVSKHPPEREHQVPRRSCSHISDLDYSSLVLRIVKQALSSHLLVDEDEDFLKKFFHLEDGISNLSGQLPLLVLPGCLASLGLLSSSPAWRCLGLTSAVFTVGLSSLLLRKHFLLNRIIQNYDNLLSSTERLKLVLNESVRLVKGMELVGKYYKLPVEEPGQMFPSLRLAVIRSTREAIKNTRRTTQLLLSDFPLSPEYDAPDHYLACVDLAKFSLSEVEISAGNMRDAVNLLLLLQSELHRRFCLTFSPELRLDMAKTGEVWRLCHQLTVTTDQVCRALETVLRYHECLGVEEAGGETRRPVITNGDGVRGELTSAGLHLQNCLLKLRQSAEWSDCNTHTDTLRTRDSLADISRELTNAKEIVEEALETVQMSINPEPKIEKIDIVEIEKKNNDSKKIIISENDEIRHEDEVFEAEIIKELSGDEHLEEDKSNEVKTNTKEKKQSKKVLNELKSVLVGKQKEWRVREGRALARQRGEEYVESSDVEDTNYKLTEEDLKSFRESHLSDESEEENGESGVRSEVGHRLLTSSKMLRRPRRPAALKQKPNLPESRETENVFTDREGRQRTINIQPSGFDNHLAAEAVKRILSIKESNEEQCFGDSDSD